MDAIEVVRPPSPDEGEWTWRSDWDFAATDAPEEATGVAVDAAGHTRVEAHCSVASPEYPTFRFPLPILLDLDPLGQLTWEQRFPGGEAGWGLQPGADGAVFTEGVEAGTAHPCVVKFTATGEEAWRHCSAQAGKILREEPDGSVLVLYRALDPHRRGLARLNADGTLASARDAVLETTLETSEGSWFEHSLAVTPAEDFIFVGDVQASGTVDLRDRRAHAIRVRSDGAVAWRRTWAGAPAALNAVLVAPDGRVFVAGYIGHQAFLSLLGPTGQDVWTKRWQSDAVATSGQVRHLALRADGALVVAGIWRQRQSLGPDLDDPFVAVVDPGGAVRWMRRWGRGTESVGGLAVLSDGSLRVSGWGAVGASGWDVGDPYAFVTRLNAEPP